MESKMIYALQACFGEKLGSALLDASKRALWTFVEVLLASVVAAASFNVPWTSLLTTAGIAALASFVKSMGIGMPETNAIDGEITIVTAGDDDAPYGGVVFYNDDTDALCKQGYAFLRVLDKRS